MLTFAAFTPHPPIILPEIGRKDAEYAAHTSQAMKTLAEEIEKADVDTIIFISPHTTLHPECMTISYTSKASGDFGQFDHPEINYNFSIDLDLADRIVKLAQKDKLPLQIQNFQDTFLVDHGVLVPYYYLAPHLPTSVKLIVIGYSALSRLQHVAFGQIISRAAQKTDQNIAVIASGDLSHRILEPGSEFIGQEFDRKIVEAVKHNRSSDIINIDEYLQEDAGECGYRSLLIMLGVLEGYKIKPQVLSYEAPFGVGYMVANMGVNPNF